MAERSDGRHPGDEQPGADELAPTPGGSRRERRRSRSLHAQRLHWSRIRQRVNDGELAPFVSLLEQLATTVFGQAATVMPHLRRSGVREHLVLVVDAARPEACARYDDFLPLERVFWTAYATIPKPAVPFMVGVRPARGWCRTEALAPLFAQMPAAEEVS